MKGSIITSLTALDSTLGRTLTSAQRAVGSGDPARAILAVLAVADGTHPDTLRQWLRSRGNAEVRGAVASTGTWRGLVKSSESYRANYSPEKVRERTSSKVVSALTLGLPAPEAALLALIAIDMMESGKDGSLLTRSFSVAMNSTQKSVTNRADSLASRGLLRVAAKRPGVPTRVRLRRSEPVVETEQTAALIADLGAGTDSALTEIFFAVRSPALSYTDLGYDAWYCSLLDALGVRTDVIPASRSSRARKRMRDLAGTDSLLDTVRILETAEVVEARDAAEAERAATAVVRAESASDARDRKRAGWEWVDSIELPRRGARDDAFASWLREAAGSARALNPHVRRYACDALVTTLTKRLWSTDRITETLDALFPDRTILRWVGVYGEVPTDDRAALTTWVAKALPADDRLPVEVLDYLIAHKLDAARIDAVVVDAVRLKRTSKFTDVHGAVPTDRDALVSWVQRVRADARDADVIHLRRLVVVAGYPRTFARKAFPDGRLVKFYAERGTLPEGTDTPSMLAWINNADAARAPKRAADSLRDDLESVGWGVNAIERALPFLVTK